MRRTRPVQVLSSAGKPITLSPSEQYHADYIQRMVNEQHRNNLGYEIQITTLTQVMKKITEQKFFEIPPADYMPIKVGDAPWSSNLTTYRSFDLADEFETGVQDMAGQNSRLATADAGVDSLNIKVSNWAKQISWTIFELEQASRSGNWDVVAAKERSRKKNWDLGIQRIAFLGANGVNGVGGSCLGLLNQGGITNNTSVIQKAISSMSTSELKVFTAAIVEAYRSNNNRTAWPTHFIIPESDYNGLASQASAEFPIKSTLQLLEETFQIITRKKDFKILPLAYGDAAYHSTITQIAGKQVYVLLNYDEESIRMDLPLDYTNTQQNSINNFQFQNVGYGQFTGVLAYRPLELMYFTYTA